VCRAARLAAVGRASFSSAVGLPALASARVLQHERDALARPDTHAEDTVTGFTESQLGGEGKDVGGA